MRLKVTQDLFVLTRYHRTRSLEYINNYFIIIFGIIPKILNIIKIVVVLTIIN